MTAPAPTKPGRQVSAAIGCRAESAASTSTAATCCGCIDMRIGTFVILVLHLVLGIYSAIQDLTSDTTTAYMPMWAVIASYVLFAISTLVYVALMYAAAMRKVSVYRPAAKVNVVVFLVSSVMSIALVAMGTIPEMNQFEPWVVWVSMAIAIALLGYWTWVVYKYAEVMEAEVNAKRRRVGASA